MRLGPSEYQTANGQRYQDLDGHQDRVSSRPGDPSRIVQGPFQSLAELSQSCTQHTKTRPGSVHDQLSHCTIPVVALKLIECFQGCLVSAGTDTRDSLRLFACGLSRGS